MICHCGLAQSQCRSTIMTRSVTVYSRASMFLISTATSLSLAATRISSTYIAISLELGHNFRRQSSSNHSFEGPSFSQQIETYCGYQIPLAVRTGSEKSHIYIHRKNITDIRVGFPWEVMVTPVVI